MTLPGGARLTYIGRPHFVCDGGVQIRADSAVAYSSQSMSHLMGNVRYSDNTRALRADEARYFSSQARLQAEGNLFVRDTVQGSIVENGHLVYLRQTDFRDQEEMTFRTWTDGIRPTALLFMKPGEPDSLAAVEESGGEPADTEAVPLPALRDSSSLSLVPADSVTPSVLDTMGLELAPEGAVARAPAQPDTTPYRVTGDEILLKGSSYFKALGDVVIVRDAITAFGQVAEYDEAAGRIVLEQQAMVESDTYDLVGRVIEIGMVGGAMREVRAIRDGVLTGDDLVLTAPVIRMFLEEGALERLVAVPMRSDPDSVAAGVPVDSATLARPVAAAEQFNLIADSLDVRSPGDVLDRIIAVGDARGDSRARDSLNVGALPPVARSDWLEGDTVIATFGEVVVPDSTAAEGTRTEYRLEQLEAKLDARSLYRLEPSDTTRVPGVDPPALHYVLGQEILIVLRDGEVDHMEVRGQTRGFHLEPLRPAAAGDSLAADSLGTDSAAVEDTVRPDTTLQARAREANPPEFVYPVRYTALPSGRVDPFHRSRRPW